MRNDTLVGVCAFRVALSALRTAAPPLRTGRESVTTMICPPGHGRECMQRFPNELVEGCCVEPLRGTKPAVKLRRAGNDAEHSHTAAVRREATNHAIADRLPVFGGVEALEVETLLKDVVLDVQEARPHAGAARAARCGIDQGDINRIEREGPPPSTCARRQRSPGPAIVSLSAGA